MSMSPLGLILSGLLLLLLLAVPALLLLVKTSVKKNPIVLLAGPSGSGKTSLFLRWTGSETTGETVTSVAPNEAVLTKHPEVTLVDTPGNERLVQLVRQYLVDGDVKVGVFVLDAASGADRIREAARPLMALLEAAEKRRFPVLIAANKYDQFNSLSISKVRSLSESELNELRAIKARTVQSSETTDDTWEYDEFLGLDGKNFEFADLETEVEVLDGTVYANRLGKWENYVQQCI